MKFNLCLKTCRTAKGLSISALAKASGVSASYLRTLEKGVYPETGKIVRPSPEILEKIGKVLCSSIQDFYDKIDWKDLTYFGIQERRSPILAEAERTLSTQRKLLLEQIALNFLEAETETGPNNVEAYPMLEGMGISEKSITWLDAEYSQSLNVFTDVSYPQQADKQTPHFGTGCCIYDGKVQIRKFAGRFSSPLGAKIGEAYAAWLGLLIGNSLRKENQPLNLFIDELQFVHLLRMLARKIEKPLEKQMSYGIALHFIHKVGTEKVPLRLWAVKSHLKWITPASVEKQAAYFWKQNGIPISFNLARILCKSNETVDRIAKEAAYGEIPVEDSMKILSEEIFDPLPLSEDCLKNFATILLGDPI